MEAPPKDLDLSGSTANTFSFLFPPVPCVDKSVTCALKESLWTVNAFIVGSVIWAHDRSGQQLHDWIKEVILFPQNHPKEFQQLTDAVREFLKK